MRVRTFSLNIFLFLLLLGNVSCGDKNNTGKGATLVFSSALTAPAGKELSFLLINISRDGDILWSYKWDSCNNGDCGSGASAINLPPETFSADGIPTGPVPVLLQVLAAFEGTNEGDSEIVHYGDTSINLDGSSASVSANVSITQFADLTNSVEAQLIGRFVNTADGHGPTGRVGMYVEIDPTKPPMFINYDVIADGFFNFFFFEATSGNTTINLKYKLMATGEFLPFGGSAGITSTTEQVMKITGPIPHYAHWDHQDTDNDGTPETWAYQSSGGGGGDDDEVLVYVGFWGPNAAGNVVCYDPANNVNAKYNEWTDPNGNIWGAGGYFVNDCSSYSDPGSCGVLQWSGTTYNANHLSRASGGVAATDARCNTSQQFISNLYFDHDSFQGGWGPATGFRGIFIVPTPIIPTNNFNDGFIDYLHDDQASELHLKWAFLPNIIGPAVSGVKILTKYGTTQAERESLQHGDEGETCSKALEQGWAVEVTTANETHTFNSITSTTLSGISIFVCPYVADTSTQGFKFLAKPINPYINTGGGGGPRVEFSGPFNPSGPPPPYNIAVNGCEQILCLWP